MRNKSGDKIRLQHILDAITEIEYYVAGTDFAGFMQNSMSALPVLNNLRSKEKRVII
jgi:uncharacterized protein with HEPN domain